jgi:hypothetical protein
MIAALSVIIWDTSDDGSRNACTSFCAMVLCLSDQLVDRVAPLLVAVARRLAGVSAGSRGKVQNFGGFDPHFP